MPKEQPKELVPYNFKPGAEWKGNAAGRPPKKKLSQLVQALLEEKRLFPSDRPNRDNLDNAEMVARGWIAQTFKGNAAYLAMLLERTEGKVPDPEPPVDEELTSDLAEAERRAIARKSKRTPDKPPE